jgi:hypothetical protein
MTHWRCANPSRAIDVWQECYLGWLMGLETAA